MEKEPRPLVNGLLETALYVADVEPSLAFYQDVLGFDLLVREDRVSALSVSGREVLLLFEHGAASEPSENEGGIVPAHDGRGRMHVAFSVEQACLAQWEEWLRHCGVEIESRVRWPQGSTSLFFRDPDGHLIELATPGLWPRP